MSARQVHKDTLSLSGRQVHKGTLIGQGIVNDDSCMHRFIFCRHALRDAQGECVVVPLTHAKASGHSLHTKDYEIILYIV